MCRLLGWVAQPGLTLRTVLGDDNYPAFTELSRIHADGWGIAYAADEDLNVRKSPAVASADPEFAALSSYAATEAAVAHLRWATPGLPVEQRNTHPFRYGDSAFAHNGGIYPLDRLRRLLTPQWQARLTGMTDSEHYYLALMAEVEDNGVDLPTAIVRVTAHLADAYLPSSLNAMLLTADALYVISCYDPTVRPVLPQPRPSTDGTPMAPRESDETYFDLRYRRTEQSVLVASSGFPQPTAAGWELLPNNSVLVINRTTMHCEELPLNVQLQASATASRPR